MQHSTSRHFLSFALIVGLLSAAAIPAPASDKEFAAVQDIFAKRDIIPLQRLHYADTYKKLIVPLTQPQLNQVALLAGKNLAIHDGLKGVKYKDLTAVLNKKGNDHIRDQWGINWACIELIRKLGEERKITDPAILPYLIQAQVHPDSSLKRYVYYCLRDLTFRDIGSEVWGQVVDNAEKEAVLRKWWQEWWQANKGKQLIIEAHFQNGLKKRVLETMRVIFDSLGGMHPELSKTHMPRSLYPGGLQLPFVVFEPRKLAFFDPPTVKYESLPSLLVEGHFLTPGPDSKKPKEDSFGKDKYKVVHQEVIGNTDVALRVLLITPNAQLEKDMIQLFAKNK